MEKPSTTWPAFGAQLQRVLCSTQLTTNRAGSRDSEFTNHGYQQATRLGHHFKATDLTFTHMFSSHLQRAVKTAGLIRDAQVPKRVVGNTARNVPDVVQLPVLMEQDFGFLEGKKWHDKLFDPKLSRREAYREEHKSTPSFVDVESKESMSRRADKFLDGYLLPLLHGPASLGECVVAVVSHGIMLSRLWQRLLLRLPQKSVSFSPEVLASGRPVSLEYLGGWSNTGYLGLHMQLVAPQELPAAVAAIALPTSESARVMDPEGQAEAETKSSPTEAVTSKHETINASVPAAAVEVQGAIPKLLLGWTTIVQTVNGKDHLKGLKRTMGGVGSARHDASQKSLDSFFKRRKAE
jgi:broad specificity phosphatase PhoE